MDVNVVNERHRRLHRDSCVEDTQARCPYPLRQRDDPLYTIYSLTLFLGGHQFILANESPTSTQTSQVWTSRDHHLSHDGAWLPKPNDSGICLTFLYSEYFRTAPGADTLCCRSAILEHHPPRVSYLYLLPTLHAISCCHLTLLSILLLIYCYYKSKPLSIPFDIPQQGLRISTS